jgi:hypothetical protein
MMPISKVVAGSVKHRKWGTWAHVEMPENPHYDNNQLVLSLNAQSQAKPSYIYSPFIGQIGQSLCRELLLVVVIMGSDLDA